MRDATLDAFLPRTVDGEGRMATIMKAQLVPADDLFGSIEAFVEGMLGRSSASLPPAAATSPLAAFIACPGVAITVDRASVRPSHVQCLLAALGRQPPLPHEDAPLTIYPIDPASGLTLWACGASELARYAVRLWRDIAETSAVQPLVALTTPWLYGNKLRLTGFIGPVIATVVGEGGPVLDLMAGTGIVARTVADRHRVSVNDANPYASLLARCQGLDASHVDVSTTLSSLRAPYAHNHAHLSALVQTRLDEELAFLHGDLDADTAEQYAAFASVPPLSVTDGSGSSIARLATERYANVYFGIGQSIEIDSLRAAIDNAHPRPGAERDLCLCALLLACTTCATGPHFAQPARANSVRSLRTIIERRARSVAWEFDLALGRLAARRPPRLPFDAATRLDWREALELFARRVEGTPAGVYVDPPYSKLQYSRYYHVLNVLLSYDYPPVAGTGRYPPRDRRFSSRFEYQPRAARRELVEVLRLCAERRLTPILSYGGAGFTRIEMLAQIMAGLFGRVDLFFEELRHHSQGRPLAASRTVIVEHVLVGRP